MKIVVDSNRIIAALLKKSTTREILFNASLEFVSPEFVLEEIGKHQTAFIRKLQIAQQDFDILVSLLFERITIIPKNKYQKHLTQLISDISDPKDIPYLACCLATKSQGIWTHDPHFKQQTKVKIYTNIDFLSVSQTKE